MKLASSCLSISLALLIQLACLPSLHAQAADELPGSLKLLPQDTAYYGSFLRLGEQARLVLDSQAIQQARELKLLAYWEEKLREGWKEQWQEIPAEIKPKWEDLQTLSIDLVDEEMFVAVGPEITEIASSTSKLFNETMKVVQENTPIDGETPDWKDLDPATQQRVIDAVLNNLPKVLPSVTLGTKLSHPEKLTPYLQQLEQELVAQLKPNDQGAFSVELEDGFQLNGTYREVTIQGHPLKEVVLPGKNLVPALEDASEDSEVPQKVLEGLKSYVSGLNLHFHWGIWGDYLLLRVSGGREGLKAFGQEPSLVAHPDLKPLVARADARFTSISYRSQAFQGTQFDYWATYFETIEEGIIKQAETETELTEEEKEELRDELRDLFQDFPQQLPEPGSVLAFEFLTPQGYEGFTYDRGPSLLDSSRPFELTKHLGSQPYWAYLVRFVDTDFYDRASKLFVKTTALIEKYGLPRASEEDRRQYLELKQAFKFHLQQFDQITRNEFIPSMKQAEFGLALAPATKLENLLPGLDEFKVPEPAMVVKLHNGQQFVQALRGYYELIPAMLETLNQVAPEESEDWPTELPIPQIRYEDEGEIYSFALPAEAEVWAGRDVGLYMGVRSDVAVFCLTSVQLKQLWKESPRPEIGLLDSNPRPAGMLFLFDHARFIEDLSPLMIQGAQLGLTLGGGGEVELEGITITRKDWIEHLRFGLKLMGTQKSYTARTYSKDGVTITRYLNHWEDLPKK